MMEQIREKFSGLYRTISLNFTDIFFVIAVISLSIYTAIESGHFFPSILYLAAFAAMMLTCKYYIKRIYLKNLLALLSCITFYSVIELYSIPFIYQVIINKWSFLVVCYILLLGKSIIPLIAGIYPAIRILMLIPYVDQGVYNTPQIIGTTNGQVSFTISAVIIFKLFTNLIDERNKYRIMSITDSLTGVSTFAHTIETAKKMILNGNISILLTDMDRFKQINDTYGHIAGNKVLLEISEFIKKETEGLDRIIGRLGGDEFIIVVRNDGSDRVNKLGKILSKAIREKEFIIDPELDPINLSFSAGQANSSSQDTDVEKLLYKADVNMYYNKYNNHRLNVFVNRQKPMLPKEGYELLNVLAEKDMYTYVHSSYTAQYAAAFARELGMSDELVEKLYSAGWLHDIGKVLISSDIVRKCGSLTRDEYTLIKKHVDYGISVAKSLGLSIEAMNCVQYHHEHWDGSGYPDGLSGEEIPYEARILKIVDSYSAMIIKRVYRKTLSQEDALQEINKNSGKQFDPELVKVFNNLIKKKIEVA